MVTAITKIITAIYIIFLNIFFLLLITLSAVATALYIGVDLTSVLKDNNIGNDRFFIRFDKKLVLEAYGLKIPMDSKDENSSSEKVAIPEIKELFKYVNLFQSAVEKIDIRDLKIGEIEGRFLYKNKTLKAKIDKNIVEVNFKIFDNKAFLNIKKLYLQDYKLDVLGNIEFNAENNQTDIYTDISLNNEVNISIYGKIEKFEKVFVEVESGRIRTLKSVFDILKLPKSAYIWGEDRAEYDYIKIKNVSTNFTISNLDLALANLKVVGEIKNLEYSFEPKLNPIKAKRVLFSIKDENLNLHLEKFKYGKNYFKNSIEIQNLYSQPHLKLEANSNIILDKNLRKTIKYFSKLEKIPVSISSKLDLDFKMDMKLYDDLYMKFIADINIDKSTPKSKDLPNINGGKIRFQFPENILKLENTLFSFQDLTDGKISGVFNIPTSNLDFDAKINKIYIDENSSMKSESLYLNINGKADGLIKTDISKTDWNFSNIETNISNFKVSFDGKNVKVINLHGDINDFNLSTKINAKYNLNRKFLKLNLGIKKLNFSEIEIYDEVLPIFVSMKNNIKISIPKLKTDVDISEKIVVSLGEIKIFKKYVPLLEKYPTISGNISTEIIDKNISIDGTIHLKQRILKDDDKFIEDFNFKTFISGENIRASINNKIFVDKSDKIDVLIEDYDFNVTGLNDFIDMNSTDKKDDNESDENKSLNIEPEINIYLQGTSIYLTDLNNSFHTKSTFLTIFRDKIYLKVKPKTRGNIVISVKNNKFILKALNLDSTLISDASNFHGIEGGDYNLYLKGADDNLNGLLQFRKLKVKDMDLVNNILAFINTVPALLTFSRPGFNHNGLRIIAGYVEFEKIGNKIYFKDIQIKGESVDISGKGYIDLEKSKIDMKIEISAIKYVDKFIGNIPIVNYLVLGDDKSIATGIIISGDLAEPDISSELHKDILFTPIEVTKRVFNLPSKVLKVLKDLNLNDKKNQENIQDFLQYFK